MRVNRLFLRVFNFDASNCEVLMATIKGSLSCENRAPQMSAYTLQRALLQWYTKQKLFPHGLSALIPAVSDWALKNGAILKKLVRVPGLRIFHAIFLHSLFYWPLLWIHWSSVSPRSPDSVDSWKKLRVRRTRSSSAWRITQWKSVGLCPRWKIVKILFYMYLAHGPCFNFVYFEALRIFTIGPCSLSIFPWFLPSRVAVEIQPTCPRFQTSGHRHRAVVPWCRALDRARFRPRVRLWPSWFGWQTSLRPSRLVSLRGRLRPLVRIPPSGGRRVENQGE